MTWSWGSKAMEAAVVEEKAPGRREGQKEMARGDADQLNGQRQASLPETAYTDLPRSNIGRNVNVGGGRSEFVQNDRTTSHSTHQYNQRSAPLETPPSSTKEQSMSQTTQDVISGMPDLSSEPSLAFEYSPALQSFLNITTTKPGPNRRRKESCSSTSTIFERSPTIPITIVVTTPDEETPPHTDIPTHPGYFPPISNTRSFPNASSMSLPSISSASLATARTLPDRSRLMPPRDPQLDGRKLRKAREFEQVRCFLIGFLNTKGDQFPTKLRLRIMSIYGIRDGDLDPNIVARFDVDDNEIKDEGVVLEHGLYPSEPGDKEHLRILELAFQSIMPVMAPQPHPAHDILAARRKRMSMPMNSSCPSVNEIPHLSNHRMSLGTHAKSKTTLDSIIKEHAASKARKTATTNLKRSSTVTSLPAKYSSRSGSSATLPITSNSTSKSRPASHAGNSSFAFALNKQRGDTKPISTADFPHPGDATPRSRPASFMGVGSLTSAFSRRRGSVKSTTSETASYPKITSSPLPGAPIVQQPFSIHAQGRSLPKSCPLIPDTSPKSPPTKSSIRVVHATYTPTSNDKSPPRTLRRTSTRPVQLRPKTNSELHSHAEDDFSPPVWLAPLINVSDIPSTELSPTTSTSTLSPSSDISHESKMIPEPPMFPSHPTVSPLKSIPGDHSSRGKQAGRDREKANLKAKRGGLRGFMDKIGLGSGNKKK